MTITTMIIAAVAAAIIAGLCTSAVRRYALSRLMDMPNERSSHSVPTPRGGGLSIPLVWTAGLILMAVLGLLDDRVALALVGGGAAIALLGWIDDHTPLRASVRLVAQLVAAAWTVFLIGAPRSLDLGIAVLPLGTMGAPLAVLGLVWLINLFNFMDGIDGLAGSEAVLGGIAFTVVLMLAGQNGLAMCALLLAAASAGFLFWNWPPARIFMGDVGSAFIGFAFGGILLAAQPTNVPALLLLLPLGVFITDATYTLVRRLLRGERVYEAHRTHIYQQLVQRGWSHREVTLIATMVNAALGVFATAAWMQRELIIPAIITALIGMIVLARMLAARPASSN
jgi:Fuc2NAc and GlcNAc transferase